MIRGRTFGAADTEDAVAADARSAVGAAISRIVETIGALQTKGLTKVSAGATRVQVGVTVQCLVDGTAGFGRLAFLDADPPGEDAGHGLRRGTQAGRRLPELGRNDERSQARTPGTVRPSHRVPLAGPAEGLSGRFVVHPAIVGAQTGLGGCPARTVSLPRGIPSRSTVSGPDAGGRLARGRAERNGGRCVEGWEGWPGRNGAVGWRRSRSNGAFGGCRTVRAALGGPGIAEHIDHVRLGLGIEEGAGRGAIVGCPRSRKTLSFRTPKVGIADADPDIEAGEPSRRVTIESGTTLTKTLVIATAFWYPGIAESVLQIWSGQPKVLGGGAVV